MLYLNLDFGFPLGRYQIEVSLMFSHWELTLGNVREGVVRHFSLGPLHASIIDRVKLKNLFSNSLTE